MPAGSAVTLRMTIEDPVPGVVYSLQDAGNAPVGPVTAAGAALSFDVPIRLAPGPKFLGDFVRREGPERRFVYIAIGVQAGDKASPWNRRAKVDIHDIPAALLDEAVDGRVLECRLPGRDKTGSPACATVKPLHGWRLVYAP
jgi:hypothetical protein